MKRFFVFLTIFSFSVLSFSQASIFIKGGALSGLTLDPINYGWEWTIDPYKFHEEGSIDSLFDSGYSFIVGFEKDFSEGLGFSLGFFHAKGNFKTVSSYTFTIYYPDTGNVDFPQKVELNSDITLNGIVIGFFKRVRLSKKSGFTLEGGALYTKVKNNINGNLGYAGLWGVGDDVYLDYFFFDVYNDDENSGFGGYGGLRLFYRMSYNLSLFVFGNYFYVPEVESKLKIIPREYTGKINYLIIEITREEDYPEEIKKVEPFVIKPSAFIAGVGIKIYF